MMTKALSSGDLTWSDDKLLLRMSHLTIFYSFFLTHYSSSRCALEDGAALLLPFPPLPRTLPRPPLLLPPPLSREDKDDHL